MRTRRHRFRAIRNLLAAVLLLMLPWYALGSPLPTREMELHRSERVCLIDPSTIVFSCESEGERMLGDPLMLVGVSKHTVQTRSRSHQFNIWPKNPGGATLVVLPSELEYNPKLVVGLAAVEPPARAVRARLAMDLTAFVTEDEEVTCARENEQEEKVFRLRRQEESYSIEGEREGAVFLFQLTESDRITLDGLFHTTDLPPYTLEFFDKGGNLLETVTNIDNSGELP